MRNTSKDPRGTWAAYVERLRLSIPLNKTAFAERIGVDRGTVHRWETGGTTPGDPDLLTRFANAFSLDPGEVFAAAGIHPTAAEPPERELDPELAEILTADLPIEVKQEIIELVLREREADQARRMERTRYLIRVAQKRRPG